MLPPIVFAHANSYPASTYRVLFERWRAAGHEVHAIEQLGHDPRYPVTTDWPHLVEQLRDFIEREVRQPAYLVGHSLGGYLSMMVASRHPHLAAGVVVMDSPLLTGWKSAGLGMAKRFKAMDRVMPSRVSAQRTHEWPSLQAAQAHFRTKPLFAAFHPDVLADYVAHGTVTHADGVSRRLSFDRDIESAIYRTVPHRLLHSFRRRPIRCPIAFIGGTHSRELRQVGLAGIRQLVGSNISWIEGSHLYPFEQPHVTARAVLGWLDTFEKAGPPSSAHPR
ncbi:alpha/beta hydrolase [Aquabacterium sp. A3]|uniref:alpha/beta fold hydrolase n=1 Tax=Aquabacterium sp. A3 TaxID=3132829 RepID=UPI0031194436